VKNLRGAGSCGGEHRWPEQVSGAVTRINNADLSSRPSLSVLLHVHRNIDELFSVAFCFVD